MSEFTMDTGARSSAKFSALAARETVASSPMKSSSARQAGTLPAFPPVLISFGDDGRVYLKEGV